MRENVVIRGAPSSWVDASGRIQVPENESLTVSSFVIVEGIGDSPCEGVKTAIDVTFEGPCSGPRFEPLPPPPATPQKRFRRLLKRARLWGH